MANMEFTESGKQAIADVLHHMQAAEAAFAKLNAVENKACFDFHNESATLNHCVRWGLQAAEEINSELSRP